MHIWCHVDINLYFGLIKSPLIFQNSASLCYRWHENLKNEPKMHLNALKNGHIKRSVNSPPLFILRNLISADTKEYFWPKLCQRMKIKAAFNGMLCHAFFSTRYIFEWQPFITVFAFFITCLEKACLLLSRAKWGTAKGLFQEGWLIKQLAVLYN